MREMRRYKQALTPAECDIVLGRNTSGVLAMTEEDGFPYAVPLSYVWKDGRAYFHWATAGRKLDAVHRDDRVSFCVIDQDEIVPGEYTTYFRSVIVFGRVRILGDPGEKRRAIEALSQKYRPGFPETMAAEIDGFWDRFCVAELSAEAVTGKQAKELMGKPV